MKLRNRATLRRAGTLAAAAAIGATMLAAPASAAAYDGVNPVGSSCWGSRHLVSSTHLYIGGVITPANQVSPIIDLYYSTACRTTWATIQGGWPAEVNESLAGEAQIHRNSPALTYTCYITSGSSCTTAMVNDSGVTSYAYGYQDSGTWDAWARTSNY